MFGFYWALVSIVYFRSVSFFLLEDPINLLSCLAMAIIFAISGSFAFTFSIAGNPNTPTEALRRYVPMQLIIGLVAVSAEGLVALSFGGRPDVDALGYAVRHYPAALAIFFAGPQVVRLAADCVLLVYLDRIA